MTAAALERALGMLLADATFSERFFDNPGSAVSPYYRSAFRCC